MTGPHGVRGRGEHHHQTELPQSSESETEVPPRRSQDEIRQRSEALRRDIQGSGSDGSSDSDSSLLSPTPFSPNLQRRAPVIRPQPHPPIPSWVETHPHRSFFIQHNATAPWWCEYAFVPLRVDVTEADNDAGDDLANRIHRETGMRPEGTEDQCVICNDTITTADDVAVSNRCDHKLHSSCCKQWFYKEAFPSGDSLPVNPHNPDPDNLRWWLTELIPMLGCPTCHAMGRWRERHNNRFIPDNKPVYAIHKFFRVNYSGGYPQAGDESRVVHIHSPQLFHAVDAGGTHENPPSSLHQDDRITDMDLNSRRLGYKMYLWSVSPSVHSCYKCKKERPWTSLYKRRDCLEWCHAALCMDCSPGSQLLQCLVCKKRGPLQDFRGSPFARNTRSNPRQPHNV